MPLSIIRTGTWRYDDAVEKSVDVIALEFDWWHRLAEADGLLERGEVPMQLGPEGCLYYVRFKHALDESEPTWVESPGHKLLHEAMREAEEKVGGAIQWHK